MNDVNLSAEQNAKASRITTVIVEDSKASLRAVISLLSLQPGIQIVGSASTGTTGLALIEEHAPDLLVTDFDMPEMDGFQLIALVRTESPRTKVLIMSVHEGRAWADLSTSRGADAFVSKARLGDELPELLKQLFPAPPGSAGLS